MGSIFASVWGEVASPVVDFVRKEVELLQTQGVVLKEEETRLIICGSLQHLLQIEASLQQKILKLGAITTDSDSIVSDCSSLPKADFDSEPDGNETVWEKSPAKEVLNVTKTEEIENKLSESVRQFANVTEITENQIQCLGLDKHRGLDTKSKHYEVSSATKFECDQCSFKTKRQSHMEKHLRMHDSNPTVYSCSVSGCPFKCIRNGDLTRHNLTSHIDPSQVFACERCSYKSSDRKCFAKHLKYSHREKEVKNVLYECSKCPYKTMKVLFFTRHMKRHGVLVDSKTAQTVNTINLKCKLCEYEAKRVEHINRHMETVHSDERKYLCQTCGIGFKRNDALKLHNLTHSASAQEDEELSEQHVCNQCNKIFRSTSTLMEHAISHENENMFKCDLCLKAFSSSSLLQKHTKAVHSASSSHVCRVCYKKFNTMFNLKRHSRTHERRPMGNNNPGAHSYLTDHIGGILHPTPHQIGAKIAPLADYRTNHNKSESIPVELAMQKT